MAEGVTIKGQPFEEGFIGSTEIFAIRGIEVGQGIAVFFLER